MMSLVTEIFHFYVVKSVSPSLPFMASGFRVLESKDLVHLSSPSSAPARRVHLPVFSPACPFRSQGLATPPWSDTTPPCMLIAWHFWTLFWLRNLLLLSPPLRFLRFECAGSLRCVFIATGRVPFVTVTPDFLGWARSSSNLDSFVKFQTSTVGLACAQQTLRWILWSLADTIFSKWKKMIWTF